MVKEVKTVVTCWGRSNDWKGYYRSLAGAGYVVHLDLGDTLYFVKSHWTIQLLFVHFYTGMFFKFMGITDLRS